MLAFRACIRSTERLATRRRLVLLGFIWLALLVVEMRPA
jgi:hypothetical protein